jgi:hypothetical protein
LYQVKCTRLLSSEAAISSQSPAADCTVTVNEQAAVLPDVSVAVHVTMAAPAGKVEPDAGRQATLATPQLSAPVGVGNVTTAELPPPHSEPLETLILVGHVRVGGSLSVTVTICWQLAEFPDVSVTVQITIVAPRGNVAGELFTTLATAQLSAVMGVPSITPLAVQRPASAFANTAGGHKIVGGSSSTTVTVCWHCAVLPEVSITVQVTVVTPLGKVAGASFTMLATAQLSAVVGEPSVTPLAAQKPGSVPTDTKGGHVIVGASVSLTVTLKTQFAVFPLASVPMQFTAVVPSGKLEPLAGVQVTVTLEHSSDATGAG